MRQVSVIGSSNASEEEYEFAYELGKELAKRNLVIICGERTGVMEAKDDGKKPIKALIESCITKVEEHYKLKEL